MLILSEKKLHNIANKDVEIKYINRKNISEFNGNEDVAAIICSRATSIMVEKLDFPNLRMIQLTSAGFDNVPLEKYRNRGINVCNAGGVYSIAMAEMVVYGIMRMQKRYYKNPNHVFLRPFRNYHYISELYGKDAIVLATGNIGTEIAKRLKAFGVTMYGYDKFVKENENFTKIVSTREDLMDVLGECDFVISTLPHMSDTDGFIDKELLKKFKSDAVFINVGRRKTINEKDLYNSLKAKQIRGAVLDMFEKVPNPFTNPFRRLSNVIVFPGVTAISVETNMRLCDFMSENINRILNGEEPICIVNRG